NSPCRGASSGVRYGERTMPMGLRLRGSDMRKPDQRSRWRESRTLSETSGKHRLLVLERDGVLLWRAREVLQPSKGSGRKRHAPAPPRAAVPRPRRSRIGIPPDVQRVLDAHRALGEAARRALHVSEKVARKNVERAARDAESVKRAAA